MKLCVEKLGQGYPLVLIHGWGMNAGVWQPVLSQLTDEWEITIIELPGHGESDIPEPNDDLSEWTQAVLHAAPESALWLGWSLGAQIAINAALAAPERVDAVVSVSGTPHFVARDGWSCGMQAELLDQFAENLFADPQRTMLRFLGLQVRGAESEREILRQLRNGINQRPEADMEALRQGLKLLESVDLRQCLGQLEVPSTWLFGSKDTLVSASTANEVKRILPEASVQVIEGAGHAPFLSHAETVIKSMREVIDR